MTSPVHTATYTYEDERNVKTVLDNVVNSLSTSKYTYAYDELARRTSRVQEGSAFAQDSFDAFGYNDRSEVIDSKRYEGADITDLSSPVALDAFAYEFDPIGNRIESSIGVLPATTYTTNELNQYTQVSSFSPQPSHDSDGNLTEQNGWFYKWNAENRLVEAYSFAADKKLEFVYDYLGRRVKKKVTQISTVTVTGEERFLYDVWNLIATYQLQTSNLTLQTSYTWGLDLSQTLQGAGGVGGLLGVAEFSGSHVGVYHFTYDVNGNVSEVLDDAGGIAAHYEYDPFGGLARSDGAYADVNPFRFSSKYLDVETELYYYGYRHYDPTTGRWPNRDPIGEEGGLNVYGMVGNDSVNLWDYLGLSCTLGSLRNWQVTSASPLSNGETDEEFLQNLKLALSVAGALTAFGHSPGGAATGSNVGEVAVNTVSTIGSSAVGSAGGSSIQSTVDGLSAMGNNQIDIRKASRLGEEIQIRVDATWDKCVEREILGFSFGTKWEEQTGSHTHTAQSTHPKANIQPIIEDAKTATKSALYK
jgi:RHS repeat-associated protein